MATADDIVGELLQTITDDIKPGRGAEVLLLINGSGRRR
jgi:dihydroxyacetone kinase